MSLRRSIYPSPQPTSSASVKPSGPGSIALASAMARRLFPLAELMERPLISAMLLSHCELCLALSQACLDGGFGLALLYSRA